MSDSRLCACGWREEGVAVASGPSGDEAVAAVEAAAEVEVEVDAEVLEEELESATTQSS